MVSWGEKALEWAWAIFLIIFSTVTAAVVTTVRKWNSMLTKHEQEIALLKQAHDERSAALGKVLEHLDRNEEKLEQHRNDSVERMETLRADLKEDMRSLIEVCSLRAGNHVNRR